MYSFIELLRALAVLLITNSHFDGVYPWDISWGGCSGVAIFFLISGFLLVKGCSEYNFFPWWKKKVMRLYIPLTLVNVVTILIGFRTASISLFVFPIGINLWYVPAISIFYIFYYFIIRKFRSDIYKIVTIFFIIVIYAINYVMQYRNEFFVEPELTFRLLYGFTAMLIGSLIYDHRNSNTFKTKRIMWLILGIGSCGGFLFVKLFINYGFLIFIKIQFITQVFGVAFALFMLLAGIGYENDIRKLMKTWIGKILRKVSTYSLDIYLVQFVIIYYLKNIIFPINFILITVLIFLSAMILHSLSNKINSKIELVTFQKG